MKFHTDWSFLIGTLKKLLENGPFCKVDDGARFFFHEQVALLRPCARLSASSAITKKKWFLHARCEKFYTVWSFFERHYKSMLENGPFCKVDAGARLFFHDQVALLRPCACLSASNAITKKSGFFTRDA